MGASPTPPPAKRLGPYVDELQEFFASACLRFGSPEDIIALTERLESSPSFAEDLGSMVRSIMLREGGTLVHSQLLEMLAVAIGGPRMDHAPQLYAQPLRILLSFISGVMRKPWNEPPGEAVTVERPHVLPFPSRPRLAQQRGHGQAAAISAAAEAAAAERKLPPGPKPAFPIPEEASSHSTAEPMFGGSSASGPPHPKVPDVVGEPTAAPSSALDPENPAHQAIEDPDGKDPGSPTGDVADLAAAAAMAEAAYGAAEEPASTPPQEIAGVEAQPAAASVPDPPAPVPAPSTAPSWQLAAKAVRGLQDAEPEPPLVSQETISVPEREPASPHTSPVPPAIAARRSIYAPHMPRTAAGILVTGAALLVLAGVFAASLHRTPTELVGKQTLVPTPVAPRDARTAATPSSVAAQPKPSAASQGFNATPAVAPSARISPTPSRQPAQDDDAGVAPPYSRPIPGQAAPSAPAQINTQTNAQLLAKPSANVPAVAPQPAAAASRPPSDEIATTAGAPAQPGAVAGTVRGYASEPPGAQPEVHTERAVYRDPDGAIAGDLPRSHSFRTVQPDRPSFLDVSSGVMAGNLIDSPLPDYPKLARLAHIGGEVILQAVIAKNGSVLATHVLRGNRLLRGAAEDAVRQWRYRPYVVDGHPVEVATVVTVRFHNNR